MSRISLYWGSASPFVRKVMAVAHELGLADRIDLLDSAANPVDRDARIKAFNPLAKVPAASADGMVLHDSPVICEYLDALTAPDGPKLFPAPGPARWTALRRQALADGMLDAAILLRYESLLRPAELRWPLWTEKQGEKIADALDAMEADVPQTVDIGAIAYGCALSWLDFRFPDLDWREGRPALTGWQTEFDNRPSMAATRPRA